MQQIYGKHGFFRFSSGESRGLRGLRSGETGISTVGRVLEVARRELQTKDRGRQRVLYGVLADESAKVPFISGVAREELTRNSVVALENVPVKRWKELPTLYVGASANLHVLGTDIEFPSFAELNKPRMMQIGELLCGDGAFDVLIEAAVVSTSTPAENSPGERMVRVDDGTGVLALIVRDRADEELIRFGMGLRVRGNAICSGGGCVFMAEAVKEQSAAILIQAMQSFLCRYT
ncbi:MAG TPA: hypothetical protein ENN68_09120 [Methanomicrobia archaeon]|nr:hypothetical protein [Methanomicrobia archaeon]